MKRVLLAVLLLTVLGLGAGILFWYFAYGADERPPPEVRLTGLSSPVTVHWQKNGVARVGAATSSDAAIALGYVHGIQRTWSLALWRQTALGRLGEWFARGVLPLDRHARRLGLGALARDAYAQLPDSARHLLTAYATGLNAALEDGAAQRHDELVLFDLSLAPWEPWHTLALERLVAWLATTPPSETALAAADSATARFFATDTRFRRWLHLYGFDRSVAWAVRHADGRPALFQRHVFGASALPLFQEVILEGRKTTGVRGAALPGTPFFPSGRSDGHAWSVFLSSPLELAFAPVDSSVLTMTHERLRLRSGSELLLTTRRTPGALPLGHPDPHPLVFASLALPDTLSPADSAAVVDSVSARRRSVWQVRWPGFYAVTDAAAWHALTGSRPTSFRLFDGRGLRVTNEGRLRVLGTPAVVERFDHGVFVGQTDWAHDQAQRLRAEQPAASPLPLASLSASDSSAWAADRMATLMPLLDMVEPSTDRLREVRTYLRNWDHRYDYASIGASIFDAWMRAHRAETDSLPPAHPRRPLPPPADSVAYVQWTDSLRADSLRQARLLRRTLGRAVDTLAVRFGPDPRRWRWERVNATPRYFPVWSADSLVDPELKGLSTTRYAPLERPGRGHPSTLAGGTSLLDPIPAAAATWEGWIPPSSSHFTVRRHQPHTDVFLGRHAIPDRPAPFPLRSEAAPVATTVLRPAP